MTNEKDKGITLAYIQSRKQELRQEIAKEKEVIRKKVNNIFSPPPAPTNKWEIMTGMINNGMAIYDGVKIGLSVIQFARRIFRK